MMKSPKHVGTWVVACTKEQELIKWGHEGDNKYPYSPDDKEALLQLKFLIKQNTGNTFYLLHVFDNGQIKTIYQWN